MPLSDEELDAYLASRPVGPAPPWLPGGFSPRWRGGAALSPEAARWLLGRLLAQNERAEEREVERLRARLDAESAAPWMDALCEAGGAAPARFGEVAWLFASLGSEPHLTALGAEIDALWRHHRALPLEVLRRNGSDAALRRLGRIVDRAWHRKLGRAALERVSSVAAARGVEPWALLSEVEDRHEVPTAGLVLPLSLDDPFSAALGAAPVPSRLFGERLAALDYRPMEVEDAGMVYHHARRLGGHLIHLDHSGVSASGQGLLRPVRIAQVSASRLPEQNGLSWREAPPALTSQALQDVRRLLRPA
ncbi:MAG: hypothetical protein VYE22_24910 [Myxococcota bacterium]|nr:hypothetical protein [Myxococcota bacterium]